MTPEEAIYVLDELMSENLEDGNDKAAKAEGLGIEALKRINLMRDMGDIVATEPLLGETEK